MKVAFAGAGPREDVRRLAGALAVELEARGHQLVGGAAPARFPPGPPAPPETTGTAAGLTHVDGAGLVFNLTESDGPRAHWRRRDVQQFGVTLLAAPEGSLAADVPSPPDVLALAYPALVQTMSNALFAVDGERLVLVTPEMGVRPLPHDAGAAGLLDAVLPLAGARFCIENDVREDLPPSWAEGTTATAQLVDGGRRLAALGLLPTPVALEGLLSEDDRRLLLALFGVQQISYGNVSVREPTGGFWMSARGVDKSRLGRVGRDVLLVAGHDRESGLLRLSVPPGCADARVSVDAIEHALLYEEWPELGAIVHVHAWMEGVDSTSQSWPCGTVELAEEVLELVGQQPDPARAAVGLRNHGLTLTGPSVASIFERVEGRLLRDVPPT